MALISMSDVTDKLREEVREALLEGFKLYEIRELLNVADSVISRERKRLEMGKWSPSSPSVTGTRYPCSKCGRPMEVKWGRYGQFIACSGYPECRNSKPYVRAHINNHKKRTYTPPKPSVVQHEGITRMPTSEIPLPQRKVGVGVTRVEFDVVRTLKPGEGVRFPCRWKHYVRRH
ncbi:topoisomerase DNA-binding C4 zinc finger domain-containing protein, partial [Candidatus Pacearchaeota archaeon]|nr:topoisomerase DNA-binding C4 zinc finger domain-containing protein [Candidatus Pacearchaeota archaeon]